MNRVVFLALSALLFAAPAAAQQQPASAPASRAQFGLGIAIFPLDADGGLDTVELYVPIAIAPNFRLEPSLGIRTSGDDGGDRSDFTLGVGAFLVQRMAPAADMYVGGRLKLNFASQEFPTGDESGTDTVLAAALGGEVYLAPRFTIGLEGQLGFYANSDVSGDNSGIFTNGLAFLRLYF